MRLEVPAGRRAADAAPSPIVVPLRRDIRGYGLALDVVEMLRRDHHASIVSVHAAGGHALEVRLQIRLRPASLRLG